MRHRFFMEDDLIKVGWGNDSTLDDWDKIMAWVLHQLDDSTFKIHVLLDFSEIYVVTEEIFQPAIAARLASHPQAGKLLLISNNPVFVHFVNAHWASNDESAGVRAFLHVRDALGWLRNNML